MKPPHEFDPAGDGYCKVCSQPERAHGDTGGSRPGHTWEPVDLTAAVDGGNVNPPPVLLERDDGARLLYRGKCHTIIGESESLKTWLALMACATAISDEQHVLFIDYEDSAEEIVGRLTALGSGGKSILRFFHYVRPDEPFGKPAALVLRAAGVMPPPPHLVVIDGITEAMAAHSLDPLSNADVATFNAKLPKPFAAAGCIVASIDHVTKSREGRGSYALGAQHKKSAVDGASYITELIRPFGHGLHGIAKIVIAKDRPGRVRQHSPGGLAGTLHLRSEIDGSVFASIAPPKTTAAGEDPEPFRPTVLMERVSRYIEATPGLSGRAVLAAVTGKTLHLRLALELLIKEGYVSPSKRGNAILHSSVKPFRNTPGEEEQDDA